MTSSSPQRPKLLETRTVAEKRFELVKKLGEGCFGEVFKGNDTKTGKEVAIKFEETRNSDTLKAEAELLEMLSRPFSRQGFVEVFHCGREGPYTCLVMELLGRSLEDAVELNGGTFDARTSAMVAEQCVLRLEYVHSKGVVHRDIKPENFMWGIGNKIHHLYIIDFGLSVKYFQRKHLPMSSGQSMTGTARYASINAHKGYTQSRRDDLEAVGHMLFYLLRGKLPWSGLKAKSDKEKFRKIQETKERFPIPELCEGHPRQFATYLEYARKLPFKERPDYELVRKMFHEVREAEGNMEEETLPWLTKEGVELENFIPVETRNQACRQPDEVAQAQSTSFFCFLGGSKASRATAVTNRSMETE